MRDKYRKFVADKSSQLPSEGGGLVENRKVLELATKQPQQIWDIARRYADVLRRELTLHSLYLFGSCVQGTQRPDSDIDIAVVADGLSGDTVDDTWYLMKLRRGIDTRIEPHPFLPSDFTEGNPAALEVMRTGIRIV